MAASSNFETWSANANLADFAFAASSESEQFGDDSGGTAHAGCDDSTATDDAWAELASDWNLWPAAAVA